MAVQLFFNWANDFSFGKDRQGNIDTIKKVAEKNNIEVILTKPYLQKEKIHFFNW